MFLDYITTPADINTKNTRGIDIKTRAKANTLLARRWQKVSNLKD
jgi:hypothetical protein